jgi:hypothetical protein
VEGRGSADELAIGVGGWIEAVLRALAVLGPAGVRLSDMVSFVFYGSVLPLCVRRELSRLKCRAWCSTTARGE